MVERFSVARPKRGAEARAKSGAQARLPACGGQAHATKANALVKGARFAILNGSDARIRFRRNEALLTIRLSRIGKKKRPFYRVIVTEKTRPRNGRFVEIVGTYDPLKKPAAIELNRERVDYWIGKGAQPSDTVRSFLRNRKPA